MDFVPLSVSHNWKYQVKQIYASDDLPSFHESLAFFRINLVILTIAQKISNKDIPINCELSSPAKSICCILDALSNIRDKTPPLAGPRRYGNFAARDWHSKVKTEIDSVIREQLQADGIAAESFQSFMNESTPYLLNSFGSPTRLDFGTGHELSFIAWIGSLYMTHLLPLETNGYELLWILNKYYALVKSLILNYTLEPAGSHGVWGLDDHFHLAYFFGACEMIRYNDVFPPPNTLEIDSDTVSTSDKTSKQALPLIQENSESKDTFKASVETLHCIGKQRAPLPSSTLNKDVIKTLEARNLYFASLSFIYKVKKGAFFEHSPILYNIGAAKSWEKVAKGLWRMYADEVLGKWPVVQHFWFGGVLYPWVSASGALGTAYPDSNGARTYDIKNEALWQSLPSTQGLSSASAKDSNSTNFPCHSLKKANNNATLAYRRQPDVSALRREINASHAGSNRIGASSKVSDISHSITTGAPWASSNTTGGGATRPVSRSEIGKSST